MEAAVQQQTKKCPACAELVLADARKCKHCGTRMVPWRPSRTHLIATAAVVLVGIAAPFAPSFFREAATRRAFTAAINDAQRCCEESVKAKIPPPDTSAAFAFCAQDAAYARGDLATAVKGESLAADGRYVGEYKEAYQARDTGKARDLVFANFTREWNGRSMKVVEAGRRAASAAREEEAQKSFTLYEAMLDATGGISKCK